jgi:hypothetical protein
MILLPVGVAFTFENFDEFPDGRVGKACFSVTLIP